MSETVWLEGANFQKPRKTYQRTDMMLARTFQLNAHNTLDLSLSVQNLFDRRYSEFYEFNEVDRRIYLHGRLNF
jgi:outer membrane receptor protein involved in Fe transport